MGLENYIQTYQRLTGARQTDPNNPYLSQGGSVPQQNEFSRLLPNHPRVASALENAALMATLIPESDTIGGNISGVAGAFLNLPMARMQRAAQPALAAQAWEAQQQELEGKRMGAYGNLLQGMYWADRPDIERERTQADLKIAQLNAEGRSPYDTSEAYDDTGYGPYKVNFKTGKTEYVGPSPLPQGHVPTFKNTQRRNTVGGTTEIERLLSGSTTKMINEQRASQNLPPMSQDEVQRSYMDIMGVRAGALSGGAAAGSAPIMETRDFLNQQEAQIYEGVPEIPTDMMSWRMNQTQLQQPTTAQAFNSEKLRIQGLRNQRQQEFGNYRRSNAPSQGVSFSGWRQQPEGKRIGDIVNLRDGTRGRISSIDPTDGSFDLEDIR